MGCVNPLIGFALATEYIVHDGLDLLRKVFQNTLPLGGLDDGVRPPAVPKLLVAHLENHLVGDIQALVLGKVFYQCVCDSSIRLDVLGMDLSVSHLVTACLETFIFSASVSWDMWRCSRSVRIRSPIFILSTSMLLRHHIRKSVHRPATARQPMVAMEKSRLKSFCVVLL